MGILNTIGSDIGSGGHDLAWALSSTFKARVLADGGTLEAESFITDQIRVLKSLGFYDKASLILTPNGYKEGKIYSLLPNSGAGDMSFTRAGTAYRKGPSLVETVPYNLLLRSEEFDNAAWTKTRSTVTANATTAPNNTVTADALLETAINDDHFTSQSCTKAAVSATFRFAICVKPNGRDWVRTQMGTASNGFAKWFNVANGTIGSTLTFGVGWTITNASISQLANGFYLCEI